MNSRKKAEKYIKDMIFKITKSKKNVELYEELFSKMSDKEFDEFIKRIGNGSEILNVIVPHDGDHKITLDNNFRIAKELGYSFLQRITIGKKDDIPTVETKHKHTILLMPFRRTKQVIEKGVSVSENDRQVDMLTGQPTNEARASRLSYPELQLLIGMGLKDSVIELLRDRGGDPGAYRALKQMLLKYGSVSNSVVQAYTEGVISSTTLKAYFAGMHFKITI